MTRATPGSDRLPACRRARRATIAALLAGVPSALVGATMTACAGPQLQVSNPGLDDLYIDGQALPAVESGTLPFRYYGTVQWRALPHDDGVSMPDFRRQPAAGVVRVEPPVSPWLFPFDFPLELAQRLFTGPRDQEVLVELPQIAGSEGPELEISPAALGALRQRAEAARTAR